MPVDEEPCLAGDLVWSDRFSLAVFREIDPVVIEIGGGSWDDDSRDLLPFQLAHGGQTPESGADIEDRFMIQIVVCGSQDNWNFQTIVMYVCF